MFKLLDNVVKTIINHSFGNGLYQAFMVIWGMVYYCFDHIMINITAYLCLIMSIISSDLPFGSKKTDKFGASSLPGQL